MQITGKITCIDEFGIELATDDKTVIIRDLPVEKVREAASYFMADVMLTIEHSLVDELDIGDSNTARELLKTTRLADLHREAKRRSARVAKFPDFTRYVFHEDSMLVIDAGGGATAYAANEEGDETPTKSPLHEYRLVPVEPNEAMVAAAISTTLSGQFYPGHTADESETRNWDALGEKRAVQIYKAMIAAAPSNGGSA